MTFDDIPAGKDLLYYTDTYGVSFFGGCQVTDHSQSAWGTPNSGANVVTWNPNPLAAAGFGFGSELRGHEYPQYTTRTVGAYFGTEQGMVLQMVGYRTNGTLVTAPIGDTNSAWSNQYVQIMSTAADIAFVHIRAVTPSDARYHFCMDDLMITNVPELSPLAARLAGLAGFGAIIRRRR